MALLVALTACLDARAVPSSETPPRTADAPQMATAAVPVTGDTFFVAPDGDDAGPGTFEAPWATVNHAAKVLSAGQTVYVREGVYVLPRQVLLEASGRADG